MRAWSGRRECTVPEAEWIRAFCCPITSHRDLGATAWSARDASFSMVICGIDPDPKKADTLKSWGRAFWKAVHPFNMAGAYVNFLMDDEEDDRVQASYGDNYARLSSIKAKYDPQNLFRVNQNIPPAKT